MRVELRKTYMGKPSMVVDFDAIPRKGETIIFNRDEDFEFLNSFYDEDEDDKAPELTVKDVIHQTGRNFPIVLLEDYRTC
jgi:hypothetical protein